MEEMTNASREQSPSSETNNDSLRWEIPCLLWNPNIHYLFHKGLHLVLILNQMNRIHTLISYLF